MPDFPYPTSLDIENIRPTFANSKPYPLPNLIPVLQRFPEDVVEDVEKETLAQLAALPSIELSGKRIAITAGSRGICGQVSAIKALVSFLKSKSADPFVVPAMGSHGGATAAGQLAVLESLGITEASVGAPIHATMEVVEIGSLDKDTPVCCDKNAFESDGIVVCNRIKAHTAFAADYESGLLKMMLIGLGKHLGTTAVHKLGFRRFHELVPAAARIMLDKAPVIFGLGIVENAYNGVAKVEAISKESIFVREKELLNYSKRIMGKMLVSDIDVLVIDALGKDVSGGGMDSNVTGRSAANLKRDYTPNISQIVIRDLTKATKGNAIGIGMADITTRRAAEKINLGITYTNALTARTPISTRIPLVAETDREAIEIACRMAVAEESDKIRIAQIANTKQINRIWLSSAYLSEIEERDDLEIDGELEAMKFDESGNQLWPAERG
ncbi:MAG: lactate racemase domain-containing protein [Verrucomicrobiota bacterium]|nr:lactate racemase domain-containing protein [Verrucomicrobiota bacterium]